MDLLEYQAKELFREVGIPILPSQTIQDPRQIKQLQIPYPVVLKSQVPSGGRGKAGGVRFVANTIDAIAAARTIFNLSILGQYPKVILAEAHYNSQQEVFLAIVLDYQLKCPVLLGSSAGGMNIKSLLANLQQVAVKESFSPFYARRLISRMGLSQDLIPSVSGIIEKMYYLFQTKDLEKIEINPLGINRKGELMALDGKITINDNALGRHPRINALRPQSDRHVAEDKIPTKISWLDWQEEKGKVAIICNNLDLAVLTWDLVQQGGVKPACGVTIESQLVDDNLEDYAERLQQILTRLRSLKNLRVVLLNIWESAATSKQVMDTISQHVRESASAVNSSNLRSDSISSGKASNTALESTTKSSSRAKQKSTIKFVLRLLDRGDWDDRENIENVYLTTSLKSAVSQAINLVKSK